MSLSSAGTTEDWLYFKSRWGDYVKATKLEGTDRVIQLLECCDEQLRKDLTRNAGGTLTRMAEDGIFPLRQFPLCQFPFGQLPTPSIPIWSIPTSSIPIWSTSNFVNFHLVNVDKVGIEVGDSQEAWDFCPLTDRTACVTKFFIT